jgi:hypothetical protein
MDATDFNPGWRLTIAGKRAERPPDVPGWETRMPHAAAA